MSYLFELPRVTKAHLADALRVKAEDWAARTSMSNEERDALMDHVEGITGGVDILQSWMGGDDLDVRVVVTGHANPGHLPREGYSDEHITISIGVLPTTEVGAVDVDPVTSAAPRPSCEECGGPAGHRSDHSGGWDQCEECGHMQNIRETPGGEPGRLTELSSK